MTRWPLRRTGLAKRARALLGITLAFPSACLTSQTVPELQIHRESGITIGTHDWATEEAGGFPDCEIYRYEAEIVQLQGLSDPEVEVAVNELLAAITGSSVSGTDDIERCGRMFETEISQSVELITVSPQILSMALSFSQYEGGIHPMRSVSTLNVDLRTGRSLALEDLFKPSSPYVQALAEYVIPELRSFCDTFEKGALYPHYDHTADAAAAGSPSYENFLVRSAGLEIVFDYYEVGPYAAGPISAVVPWDLLRSWLREGSAVAAFLESRQRSGAADEQLPSRRRRGIDCDP